MFACLLWTKYTVLGDRIINDYAELQSGRYDKNIIIDKINIVSTMIFQRR